MEKQLTINDQQPTDVAQTSVLSIIEKVASQDIPIENLERLLEMQTRWEEREAKKAFVQAMTALQSEIPVIVKSSKVNDRNGRLLYKFAPLDQIVRTVQPLAQKHGFSHKFDFKPDENGITTICIVTHLHGHSEPTTVHIPSTTGMNTNSAQDAGIMQQYGMRYAYCGAYGITTANNDTDGHTQPETVNEKQIAEIEALLSEIGVDREKFLRVMHSATVEDIPASRFQQAINTLEAKRRA